MPFGKSIRIFLPEATVTGIRHAEIINRTGQAVACPRKRIDQIKEWPETHKPGVYFLFEARLGDSKPLAYIGESEDVARRILEHDRERDFWNEVVIFSNKDDNLSKSHIKYLESRLESIAKSAERYKLENEYTPTQSSLSRSECEAMEELLEDIRLVLGTLGYPILEPLIQSYPTQPKTTLATASEPNSVGELKFTVHKLIAKGVQTDEGFVLKKDSTISKTNTDSLNTKLVKLKEQLIADGRLKAEREHLRLTEDILMSSSSYAAAFVAGTARSGPQGWRSNNGKTLKELEDQAAENS
jgi:hypothetical protein